MTVTHKERMRRALRHEPVDRIPTQVNYTQAMGQRLAAGLGVTPDALPQRLDNHLLRLDLTYEDRRSEDGRIAFDWWGVGFDRTQEGYFDAVHPLADKHLDSFAWADPHAPGLLDRAARLVAQDAGERFVAPNFGFALFERAWMLRGFDTFLMDMIDDPGFAAELLDRITEIQLVLIQRFLALGLDGAYFGDDYGAQNTLLLSPKMWRALIKPRLARLFAPFVEAGLPVILHSDGQIAAILPDLLEIGMTVLNPVQPEVIDHAWLRATFGDRLACYGGISTQTVLPQGSPQDVGRAVAECRAVLAPDDTGLVIGPSHRLMTDVPLENVEALLAAITLDQPSHAGSPGYRSSGSQPAKAQRARAGTSLVVAEDGRLTMADEYAILTNGHVTVNGNVNELEDREAASSLSRRVWPMRHVRQTDWMRS